MAIDEKVLSAIISEVSLEFRDATMEFGPFNSTHEGWAVIQEELNELWDEIKARNPGAQSREAVQVAAMAIRYLHDFGQMEHR